VTQITLEGDYKLRLVQAFPPGCTARQGFTATPSSYLSRMFSQAEFAADCTAAGQG